MFQYIHCRFQCQVMINSNGKQNIIIKQNNVRAKYINDNQIFKLARLLVVVAAATVMVVVVLLCTEGRRKTERTRNLAVRSWAEICETGVSFRLVCAHKRHWHWDWKCAIIIMPKLISRQPKMNEEAESILQDKKIEIKRITSYSKWWWLWFNVNRSLFNSKS